MFQCKTSFTILFLLFQLFVVEVIQFRNSFDSQGPAVPGVQPAEAVSRLHEFQEIFKLYDSKRRTLDSVSRLFGIVCKPFPELDKTGEVGVDRDYSYWTLSCLTSLHDVEKGFFWNWVIFKA